DAADRASRDPRAAQREARLLDLPKMLRQIGTTGGDQMNLSTFLRDGLLDHLFREAASPRLDAYHVALFTTPPDPTGANGVEVSTAAWTNYARQPIDATQAGTRWKAAEDGPLTGQRHTDNLDD